MTSLARYTPENAAPLRAHLAIRDENTPDWAIKRQGAAAEALETYGLPSPKLERFKYFNLPRWLKERTLDPVDASIEVTAPAIRESLGNVPDWARAMLESEPPGALKYKDMMLWQANDARLEKPVIIDVPAGETLTLPIELTLVGRTGQATAPRILCRLGKNAQVSLIEYQMGEGEYWTNAVFQIDLAEGAKLHHYRFQENSLDAAMTINSHVSLGANATYNAFTLTAGAQLSRNQIHADIDGEEASCLLNGVNILSGNQEADTTITVDHIAPNCMSSQNYRNVLAGKAQGTFQGKVHVHRPAQKTDGYQLSNSLLLTGDAVMNTKPELEIYADDVKCSHGATTGMLDKNALFYLRARGISESEARALLIKAFLSEVIEDIANDDVREQVQMIVDRWLKRDMGQPGVKRDGWL